MSEPSIHRPSPVQHAMLFGLELGVWFGVKFIVDALTVSRPGLSFLSFLLTFYIIYGAYRSAMHFRVTECDDKISYGQALSYIVWLYTFAGVVASLIRMIYLKWFDTEYLNQIFQQSVSALKQLGMGENVEAQNAMQQILTPVRYSVYCIFSDVISGGFIGLILSIFVTRKTFKKQQ